MSSNNFSARLGFTGPEPEVSVTHDAPYDLRGVLVDIAYECDLDPHSMRSIVCGVLRVRANEGNWSAFPNVDGEVRQLLDGCAWNEVYDVIEATYQSLVRALKQRSEERPNPARFAEEINRYFRKKGIGWQLVDGELRVRGEQAFERAMVEATATLDAKGQKTAAAEIREALHDLSRRPDPDRTGALQHGVAALECVMREACGDPKATLGTLLSRHKGMIPPPLDQGVEKIWGFASEQGRHLQEGREPEAAEAELAVHVAAAVATYLGKKQT